MAQILNDLRERGLVQDHTDLEALGALLGKADERGHRAGDGFTRCLAETAARMPSKRPALRAVRPSAPVDVITPERAQELAAQFRAARAERERERAAAEREVANG